MLGELISAGANLLGNFLNRSSQQEANKQQMAIAQQNFALQREAMTHGIRYKVEDAKAAGLHPLAALGASVSSPSPVSLGGEAPKMDFSGLGQDLSRAAKAMQEEGTRRAIDEGISRRLGIQAQKLNNEILGQEVASRAMRNSVMSGQLGPPVPLPRPGPSRSWSGEAVGSKPLEDTSEAIPQYKRAHFLGLPWMSAPSSSDAGNYAEERYGDEHPITKAAGWATFVDDLRYNAQHGLAPWAGSLVAGRDSPKYRRVRRAARNF